MRKEEIGRAGNHPTLTHKWNFGQRAADKMTSWMGSWGFLIAFGIFLILWVVVNAYFFMVYELGKPWDPYPFILLNLVLSSLTAMQAPLILMSQNRLAQKDRLRAEYDYQVNRKAEREIEDIQDHLHRIESKLNKR